MMRRHIYDYFFLALLGFVFYGILKILSPFAGALLAAFLCAVTFYPLYQALHRRFPTFSPSFRAILIDLLVFIFFVTPVIVLGWAVLQESTSLMMVVKEGSTTLEQWRGGNALANTPWIDHIRFFLNKVFGVRRAVFEQTSIDWVNAGLAYVSLSGTYLAKHAILLVLDLMIMLFALFFMFRDGARGWLWAQHLLPIRHEHKQELATRIHDATIGIARGLFLTSLVQGVAATIGYLLVGAEGAVLLGLLTAAMGLLPVVGTFGIWVPASVFFFLKGAYLRGAFLLLWGLIVVVGLVDTLIRPYLVGNKLKLPLFALFFALLGGAEVWGVKGLLLGPLLVAIAPVLLDIYRQNYLRRIDSAAIGISGDS